MAKWKLCRQTYGNEIYEFTEGDEVTIGRGTQNKIILSSLNISRKHCVISVKKDEVIIEDLRSANGIFVGLKKITPSTPFSLSNNDVIGLGWTDGAPLAKVNDSEKFVFKLIKTINDTPLKDRIEYQNENEPLVAPPEKINSSINLPLPKVLKPTANLSLKRKSNIETESHNKSNDSITHLSNNCIESSSNLSVKKFKYNFVFEDPVQEPIIKTENEDEQYEAFNIKQECFDDEVQLIDSDSDSEQWYIRLSQSSPRKSFSSFNESRKSDNSCQQDTSYSQLDDDVIFVKNEAESKDELDDEEYKDDLFTILPQPTFTNISNMSKETDNKNNLMPELTNSCYVISDKSNEVKHSFPTSNSNNILDNMSDNKTTDAGNEGNKQCENNIMPKLTNACNDSIEKSMEVKKQEGRKELLLPIKSPPIMLDHTSNNKNIEKDDKIIDFNASSKKNKEIKHTILCEIDTKKAHKPRQVQLTGHKSSPSTKTSPNFTGKIKKKNNKKKSRSSSSKIQITNSQKEERKKKLRDIAVKGKVEGEHLDNSNLLKNEESVTTTSKQSAKVTTSNRGAFLSVSTQLLSKPTNKKKVLQDTKIDDPKEHDDIITTKSLSVNETKDHNVLTDQDKEHQKKCKKKSNESKTNSKHKVKINVPNIAMLRRHSDNITKESDNKKHSPPINKEGSEELTSNNQTEKSNSNPFQLKQKENISLEKCNINKKDKSINDNTSTSNQKETSADVTLQYKTQEQLPKKKPVLESSIKPVLKPMMENREPNRKGNKRVTFSEIAPQVLEFEIEPGNQMKKTSTVKSALLARHHNMPVISLQKIALMKILRWNPSWLEEQKHFNEPPPILGHNNIPMAILHSFTSHTQYVELIGDLILMEIWECLTQGHNKTRNENSYLPMRIESLPLVPPQGLGLELINITVNVSVPKVQEHVIPREGEIMMIQFGEEGKICRFFFVHNVRCLPSPPNNINSFFSISLQTSFTDKMRTLQRGATMFGRRLAYVNKDLRLFEAMEYLSRSPLNEVILNPQPDHFLLDEADRSCNLESQWSQALNESQRKAVTCAVSAARCERPRIHMIQGPPGTGKSRVICAIVMEYFYDAAGKKQKNRGKILLCATSNAAVDELVIRLLDIRQSLPQPERLKLVRVGRAEAMHPRAFDISSVKLAQRDVARLQPDPAHQNNALTAEISLLEAKKNMWQTKAMSTDDDARKAYCQTRVAEITKKIAMFRSGGSAGGAGCAPEQLAQAERRVLEGADVVLTTLASAHSHKMRGLVGRIALCVVDEAGQAIEPETLAPLTLGVTRLALVGDPQQLPGFICSQRAKQHGLGESLFSRLSSVAETWSAGGPVLLDRQYRMHPHIADYPNRAFYEGRVHNETIHALAPALHTAPYFVLGIISGDNGQDASGANDAEAWGAARVALALRSRLRALATPPAPSAAPPAGPAAPPAAHSLAVITPYAAQRDLVRRHLRTLLQAEGGGAGDEGGGPGGEVEVNTVDSFQGQERSVVVVSLARSQGLGFLAAAGRMNVMLTRAKHALVLCLNPRALEKNNQWRSLVEDAQKRNLYGTLPIHMCQPPSVKQVSNQEILQYISNTAPGNNARNPPHRPFKHWPNKKHRRRHDHGRN